MSDNDLPQQEQPIKQQTPEPLLEHPNDTALGGNYIDLSHISNYKHKQLIRDVSDFIDENHAKITDDIGITTFNPNTPYVQVLRVNTYDKSLNGSVLIDALAYLYSPVELQAILSTEAKYNDTIGVLIDNKKKRTQTWKAKTFNPIDIAIKLKKPSIVKGMSFMFSDSSTKSYKFGIDFVAENDDIISQLTPLESSNTTNLKQIIALKNPIEDIDRIIIHMDVEHKEEGEEYEMDISHIGVLGEVNTQLLDAMNTNYLVDFTLFDNPVFVKKDKTKINIDQEIKKL